MPTAGGELATIDAGEWDLSCSIRIDVRPFDRDGPKRGMCGAQPLIVAMTHTARGDRPRIRTRCEYPLTAKGFVDLIVTDLAVIEVHADGLLLTELAPGIDPDYVQSQTEPALREMDL